MKGHGRVRAFHRVVPPARRLIFKHFRRSEEEPARSAVGGQYPRRAVSPRLRPPRPGRPHRPSPSSQMRLSWPLHGAGAAHHRVCPSGTELSPGATPVMVSRARRFSRPTPTFSFSKIAQSCLSSRFLPRARIKLLPQHCSRGKWFLFRWTLKY